MVINWNVAEAEQSKLRISILLILGFPEDVLDCLGSFFNLIVGSEPK